MVALRRERRRAISRDPEHCQSTARRACWRGSGSTLPCPIRSVPCRHASVEQTSLAPSNGEGGAWAATATEAAVTKLRKPMNDLAAAICNRHGAARVKILGENRQRLIGWHFG